ncbi:MAG: hypothetical protein HQK49_17300 [Oligoflexia bacterium]|nr:hypothetical protein [Oligoflexia bacterium]
MEAVKIVNNDESPKTKKCPYCGEEILVEAIKCKHCSEFLVQTNNKNNDIWTNIKKILTSNIYIKIKGLLNSTFFDFYCPSDKEKNNNDFVSFNILQSLCIVLFITFAGYLSGKLNSNLFLNISFIHKDFMYYFMLITNYLITSFTYITIFSYFFRSKTGLEEIQNPKPIVMSTLALFVIFCCSYSIHYTLSLLLNKPVAGIMSITFFLLWTFLVLTKIAWKNTILMLTVPSVLLLGQGVIYGVLQISHEANMLLRLINISVMSIFIFLIPIKKEKLITLLKKSKAQSEDNLILLQKKKFSYAFWPITTLVFSILVLSLCTLGLLRIIPFNNYCSYYERGLIKSNFIYDKTALFGILYTFERFKNIKSQVDYNSIQEDVVGLFIFQPKDAMYDEFNNKELNWAYLAYKKKLRETWPIFHSSNLYNNRELEFALKSALELFEISKQFYSMTGFEIVKKYDPENKKMYFELHN